jgi:hypothetical protein
VKDLGWTAKVAVSMVSVDFVGTNISHGGGYVKG